MAIFTDTMTVYNRHGDGWNRTVIKGVMWRHAKKETAASDGRTSVRLTESVTADFSRDYGNPQYLPPKQYAALTDAEGYWTLDPSTGLDVVVYGETEDEIGSALTVEELQRAHEWAGTVREVSDSRNRDRLKNIKAVAY